MAQKEADRPYFAELRLLQRLQSPGPPVLYVFLFKLKLHVMCQNQRKALSSNSYPLKYRKTSSSNSLAPPFAQIARSHQRSHFALQVNNIGSLSLGFGFLFRLEKLSNYWRTKVFSFLSSWSNGPLDAQLLRFRQLLGHQPGRGSLPRQPQLTSFQAALQERKLKTARLSKKKKYYGKNNIKQSSIHLTHLTQLLLVTGQSQANGLQSSSLP